MVALAFSWIAAGLAASDAPGLYITGSLLGGLPFAILTHLLFAFPSGRLQSTWDRRFVALGYLVTTVGPAIGILFFDPAVSDDCPECPDNPLLIGTTRTPTTSATPSRAVLAGVVLGALIWHLVRRIRELADPVERVRDAPVWWAGGATLVLVLALLATAWGPRRATSTTTCSPPRCSCSRPCRTPWLGVVRSQLWQAT